MTRLLGAATFAAVIALGAVAQESNCPPEGTGVKTKADERATATSDGQMNGFAGGRSVRLSELLNKSVKNTQGERIGSLKDIVIETGNGRATYAVVSLGDVSATGDKLLPIPWAAMSPSEAELVLDVPKDRLRAAPAFASNAWPDFSDRRWGTDVHTFYGKSPFWEARVRDESGNGAARAVRGEDFPPGTFENAEVRSYSGTIASVEDAGPTGNVHVMLRIEGQPERSLYIAPKDFLKENDLELRANEPITVKAIEHERDGRKVLVATDLTMGGRTVVLRENGAARWGRHSGDATARAKPAKTIQSLSGTVVRLDRDAAEGGKLVLRTDAGERTVMLGPKSFLDQKRIEIKPDEQVTIRGFEKEKHGKNVFVAIDLKHGDQTIAFRGEDGAPLWERTADN